jgi:hypothetical protein
LTLFVVSFLCTIQSCLIPQPQENPAYSFYASREACERRLSIARLPTGLEGACIETETVTYSQYGGFSANASIMINVDR